MNWYKKANLLGDDFFVICSYCHRWKTDSDKMWKTKDELDESEKAQVKFVEDKAKERDFMISHGICQYCKNILDKSFRLHPEEVKRRSLSDY